MRGEIIDIKTTARRGSKGLELRPNMRLNQAIALEELEQKMYVPQSMESQDRKDHGLISAYFLMANKVRAKRKNW